MTEAEDLIALVRELRAPFGLERSVKIAPGALYDDRCLLSVHRSALGPAPTRKLEEMTRRLEIPEMFARELSSALEGADVVHFGHERGATSRVAKVYFEYAARARQAIGKGEAALVHLAFKWSPGLEQGAAMTRYTSLPCRTRADFEAAFRLSLPMAQAPRALPFSLALLSRVATCAERGELLMMDVEEPGNPRRSVDLNVYNARLRLRDVADLVDVATRDFEVPADAVRAAFGSVQGRELGHLSAGVGRDRAEFVTLYFGVEAH